MIASEEKSKDQVIRKFAKETVCASFDSSLCSLLRDLDNNSSVPGKNLATLLLGKPDLERYKIVSSLTAERCLAELFYRFIMSNDVEICVIGEDGEKIKLEDFEDIIANVAFSFDGWIETFTKYHSFLPSIEDHERPF